jgi:hypothetical protein
MPIPVSAAVPGTAPSERGVAEFDMRAGSLTSFDNPSGFPSAALLDTCAECSQVVQGPYVGGVWQGYLAYGDECSNTGAWQSDGDCSQCPTFDPDCAFNEYFHDTFASFQDAWDYVWGMCGYGCHPMRGGDALPEDVPE